MAELVRFRGEDGSVMLVELEAPRLGGESDVGLVVQRGGDVADAATRLEDSLQSVQGAAVALMSTVKALREREGEGRLALDGWRSRYPSRDDVFTAKDVDRKRILR